MLGIGAAVLIGAILAIAVGEGGPRPQRIGEIGPVQQLLGGIPQDGALLGEDDAEVTVEVFTDLRCPSCADYQVETIDPLIERLARTGEARFALRHYSLGPEQTTLPAAAATAAGEQGHQWQYADLLLRNLDEAGAEVDDEFLVDVADTLPEFDLEQWQEDRASREVEAALTEDYEEGTALELQADGPSVLVAGPEGRRDLGVEPSAAQIEDAVAAVS